MHFKDEKGVVFWIMGPTSSGKTTLANLFLKSLRSKGILAIHYDGDEVRNFFGDKLGFENDERLKVVKTIAHLSNKAADSGLTVVVSALTANDDARKFIRNHINNLVIVYLKCSIKTCRNRDPKGLYLKAQKGEINTLIGFNTCYEPVSQPDITIDSENGSIDENVELLISFFFENYGDSTA